MHLVYPKKDGTTVEKFFFGMEEELRAKLRGQGKILRTVHGNFGHVARIDEGSVIAEPFEATQGQRTPMAETDMEMSPDIVQWWVARLQGPTIGM